MKATMIVVEYLTKNGTHPLSITFEGEAAESVFGVWARTVGQENIVKVRGEA